ncbi:LysM peptidoglycan-binding domain-containing protein [Propylenella binzhouense]|uniref:LysM domain-containing protein n=1 Tax=Propylenella binzhouense TaxID=2555902 RepID=A0A964T5Q3_9HYPH|nr:LysM domain-containing protein [Propylenella binzhouense]MYZ48894.1 LysM domain-containing protein [Propylenella binzhouense]
MMFRKGAAALLIALAMVPSEAPAQQAAQPAGQGCGGWAEAKPGETLDAVAARCGGDRKALVELNPQLADSAQGSLRAGEIVYLPGSGFSVLPPQGPVGQTLTLGAEGLPPNSEIQVLAGESPEGMKPMTRAETDDAGRLTAHVDVPEWAEYGKPLYLALETAGVRFGTSVFRVESRQPRHEPGPG